MQFRYLLVIVHLLFTTTVLGQLTPTVGLFRYEPTAYDGYNLFTPNNSTRTFLIDNCGDLVHEWTSEHEPGLSVYLLENGNLLRTARIPSNFSGGGSGGRLQLFDWNSNLLWQYDYSSPSYHQHHDIYPMPNGNILILAWESHSAEEALSVGINPDLVNPEGIWVTQLVEVKPILETNNVEIVWQWSLWDHLIQSYDPNLVNFGEAADYPERVDINAGPVGAKDWIHANGIDYNEELDQIIINSRNFGEFWIIDHSTTTEEAASSLGGNSGRGGDLLYRWGNPRMYGRGTIEDQQFFGQHHANWIDEGLLDEGKIMVFNNGNRPESSSLPFSTVDVIDPPINSDGIYEIDSVSSFRPEVSFWQYTAEQPASFYSSRISGATRLPNGNTLICEGNSGRFFEVTYEKEIVWEYINPIRFDFPIIQGDPANQNDVFRTTRYPLNYPAFEEKDLTPQGKLELEPIDYFCSIGLGITDTLVHVTSPTKLLEDIYVVNNPVVNELRIQKETTDFYSIQIFNVTGRLMFSTNTNQTTLNIDVQDWQQGMYFVQFQNNNFTTFATQKIVKSN